MIKRSTLFCTQAELENINRDWKQALDTPVMIFRTGDPDLASIARRKVMESIDALAVKHGLPSKSKFWGMDLLTGEFVYDEGPSND